MKTHKLGRIRPARSRAGFSASWSDGSAGKVALGNSARSLGGGAERGRPGRLGFPFDKRPMAT